MRQTIDRQSRQLTRMVDDLLDVNRVARGHLQVDKQRRRTCATCSTRAIETSRPLLEHAATTSTSPSPANPCRVDADPMRLAQVFTTSSTTRRSTRPDGGDIWLHGRTRRRRVAVRISRQRPRHPARFHRPGLRPVHADRSVRQRTRWTGCGAGVGAARIVELHGGSVQAISEGLARGSEFVVRLPVGGSPDSVPAGDGMPVLPDSSPPLRALVIDDNRDAADSFCMLMKAMGHDVRAATDGPSGIVVAQEFRSRTSSCWTLACPA